MNDENYRLIGRAFSGLLEEDIQRINNLLYHASRTNSSTASRLYSETRVRLERAAKSLREIRKREDDLLE